MGEELQFDADLGRGRLARHRHRRLVDAGLDPHIEEVARLIRVVREPGPDVRDRVRFVN